MRQVLADDALADLTGISPASLRRYAKGERTTPQPVAERLHWIAMVTSDLAASYNEFGIRRWFERPRSQLNGRSPRQLLNGDWTPSSTEAPRIKNSRPPSSESAPRSPTSFTEALKSSTDSGIDVV